MQTFACCRLGSDEKESDQLQVVESPSRRSTGPRYARLGKRQGALTAGRDNEDDRLTMSHRAVPANFRFAGLGKRRVSLAYKAAGLGKRDGDNWTYDTGVRPEMEISHTLYDDPVYDNFVEFRPKAEKRRVSMAMRYAGIGKRQRFD